MLCHLENWESWTDFDQILCLMSLLVCFAFITLL
jgi:hypothetical protein